MVSPELSEEIAPSADVFICCVSELDCTRNYLQDFGKWDREDVCRESVMYSQVIWAMSSTGADCGWHSSSPEKIALKCHVLRTQLWRSSEKWEAEKKTFWVVNVVSPRSLMWSFLHFYSLVT